LDTTAIESIENQSRESAAVLVVADESGPAAV